MLIYEFFLGADLTIGNDADSKRYTYIYGWCSWDQYKCPDVGTHE